MTSPRTITSHRNLWLIATLVLASCASSPPARDVDDAVRSLRAEYLQAHPDGPFNGNIERGEVAVGMKFEDVVASWGIPEQRERSGDGQRERWSYTVTDQWNNDWVRYDLLFESRALVAWETMRNVASSHPIDSQQRTETPPVPTGGAGLAGGGVTRR